MAEVLSAHAYPRIDRILASRFRQSSLPRDQMDDVRNEIVVRLVKRLQSLSGDPAAAPIASFPDYVAVVAFNTFDDFLRRALSLRTHQKDCTPTIETQHTAGVESVAYLRNLWTEICALPLRQRVALLLHARAADGEPVVRLLPLARVATIRAVAETLEMSAEELAALWRLLPLDDLAIAERLGATRPQVISLRRAARERLTRRLHGRAEERKRR